jgi:PAS domain-containing protein
LILIEKKGMNVKKEIKKRPATIRTLKKTEELLKESERRQAVFLSHLPGLAYRCNYDRKRTMQYVSNGCYDLTGYHPESLIGNKDISFKDIIADIPNK